ncbi:hypothetical protein NUW58_g5371 [Xylaria curta]|uniref:Uncharacterized protein n=1 Tax=Xylaria curta TaxID=42375 RepID=A0ACC1P205_9PEZI|nr:hypothetical protein NUW58_g5371 [Xylaria curta]
MPPIESPDSVRAASQDPPHDAGNDLNNKRKRAGGSSVSEHMQKRLRELIEDDMTDELTTEVSEEDLIERSQARLLDHAERQSALFFVELAPPSPRRGAGCQFIGCQDKIEEDHYRIAVYPGMKQSCFEILADFSKTNCLKRLTAVTRATFRARNLKAASVSDGNYLLDGGAERLVLHWKFSMGRLIDERDGLEREPDDPDFIDILYKAGSASYTPRSPEGMPDMEYLNLIHSLAPIESDGPDDEDEWNLINKYAPLGFEDLDDLNQTNSLSSILEAWRFDRLLVTSEEDLLTEKGKKLRNELSEKAIRAIEPLSAIQMPNFQAAFFGGSFWSD